ncbi:hypothetical protein GINT2_001224 [Glugoides intestinalis]
MATACNERRDYYYYQAKVLGYRARSAFKLLELDEKHNILSDPATEKIVDLCAAPGSWSQVISEKVKGRGNAKIIAVDVQEMVAIEGVEVIKEDITSKTCLKLISNAFNNEKADLVVCDGAPDVTGFRDLDEFLQTDLLTAALSLCLQISKPNSSFVAKIFKGEFTDYVVKHFMKFFKVVELEKPKSSRKDSAEWFIVCKGMQVSEEDPYKVDIDLKIKN